MAFLFLMMSVAMAPVAQTFFLSLNMMRVLAEWRVLIVKAERTIAMIFHARLKQFLTLRILKAAIFALPLAWLPTSELRASQMETPSQTQEMDTRRVCVLSSSLRRTVEATFANLHRTRKHSLKQPRSCMENI